LNDAVTDVSTKKVFWENIIVVKRGIKNILTFKKVKIL
tara:strand:+ start:2780 stop:2893 length:114 start_codon:yes stop_codon:yes gene_type:complete